MLFLRSEMRLDLAVEHQQNGKFSASCWGHLDNPENDSFCRPRAAISGCLHQGAFSLRRQSALQIVARSYVTCGKQIQALTPTVNLVPMKGERVPWLESPKGFQKGKSRSYA